MVEIQSDSTGNDVGDEVMIVLQRTCEFFDGPFVCQVTKAVRYLTEGFVCSFVDVDSYTWHVSCFLGV